jgi:hypothetical protein
MTREGVPLLRHPKKNRANVATTIREKITTKISVSPVARCWLANFSTLPFLKLAISEMEETSHWPTHRWNVMSEQRKSNWKHPNTYHWEREETQHSATDECNTSRHPQPYRTLPAKAVQIIPNPGRDGILEAIHFVVEIGNSRHPRSSGIHSTKSPGRGLFPTEAPRGKAERDRGAQFGPGAPMKSVISGIRLGHFGPHGGADTAFY